MLKLTMEEFLLRAEYSAKAIELYMGKVNVGSVEDLSETRKNGTIQYAKFEYKGCVRAACSGCALTTLVMGKTVNEAWNIAAEEVLKELNGLQESRCAKLAANALHKALEKLEERNKN